jgi:hypothetical protein
MERDGSSKSSAILTEEKQLAEGEAKTSRNFFRIASGSAALGLGCAFGSLEALRRNPNGFSFEFSCKTLLAFAIGAAVAFLYWWFAAKNLTSARRGAWWLFIGGVAMFLYPLRFVPPDKSREMVQGLMVAVCALSGAAFLFWQIKRFLDLDTKLNETAGEPARATSARDQVAASNLNHNDV